MRPCEEYLRIQDHSQWGGQSSWPAGSCQKRHPTVHRYTGVNSKHNTGLHSTQVNTATHCTGIQGYTVIQSHTVHRYTRLHSTQLYRSAQCTDIQGYTAHRCAWPHSVLGYTVHSTQVYRATPYTGIQGYAVHRYRGLCSTQFYSATQYTDI